MPLDPKTFPRPPLLERVAKHILVKWPGADGPVIADTRNAYWVLETYHPPMKWSQELTGHNSAYYIPKTDVKATLTPTPRQTYCEWKGPASYFSIQEPSTGNSIENKIWTYNNPTPRFKDIAGHLSFYAEPWECFVDGEKVDAQAGSFYGGWMTSDILRESVKGAPGTLGW
ncbi:MAG: hypothetical protein M1831_002760 [Alyxoria varia]|nr:MAG: hypothetical protein M1831_002760 [Alyxoria varia]